MNKFCTLLFLVLVFAFICSAQVSQTSGFFNDNYTGSEENGRKGLYIGADDFLTFGLFSQTRVNAFDLSIDYSIITSRQQKFRYDMVHVKSSYAFQIENLTLSPGFGFLVKGQMGGESFQNNFHSLRDIPPLNLPYTGSDFALVPGLSAEYRKTDVLLSGDKLTGILNSEIPLGIKPASVFAAAGYRLKYNVLAFDLLYGYKLYLTNQKDFSDFVRSGFVLGGQVVLTLNSGFSINTGFYVFPAKNLENDPVYETHEHDYSPQFWVSLGYNGEHFRIQDLIDL